jgi:hypothetical protein
MDHRRIIKDLCSKGHRGSTTENERWAAGYIADKFREMDLEPELQNFYGHKCFPTRIIPSILISLFGGIIGLFFFFFTINLDDKLMLLLLILIPAIGSLTFLGETTLKHEIFSRLFHKGNSVNVLAKIENPDSRSRVILVAHTDSQRGGFLFSPKFVKILSKFTKSDLTISPILIIFIATSVLCLTNVLLYYIESNGILTQLTLIFQILVIFYLFVSLYLMTEWSIAKYVPGANDNATGVAVLLSIAEKELKNKKENKNNNLDYWFLSTGCEETGAGGSFAFNKKYAEELKTKPTNVIIMDGFGVGKIHYFSKEGLIKKLNYDPALLDLCQEISVGDYSTSKPFISNAFTDGLPFAYNNIPTVSLVCTDFGFLNAHFHWHSDIPENINYDDLLKAEKFVEMLLQKITQKA